MKTIPQDITQAFNEAENAIVYGAEQTGQFLKQSWQDLQNYRIGIYKKNQQPESVTHATIKPTLSSMPFPGLDGWYNNFKLSLADPKKFPGQSDDDFKQQIIHNTKIVLTVDQGKITKPMAYILQYKPSVDHSVDNQKANQVLDGALPFQDYQMFIAQKNVTAKSSPMTQ